MTVRRLTLTDQLLTSAQRAASVLSGHARAERANPAGALPADEPTQLNPAQRRLASSLMRVNHVGEICAQALYEGQGLMARNPVIREELRHACREERDHLAWTADRLTELKASPSILNPLWYGASFVMGMMAGRAGDRISMGFMNETERQVEAHLESHLRQLPTADTRSRAIVAQMKQDEVVHAATARRHGAVRFPAPARFAMKAVAKVMTTTAHYF